MKIWAQYLESQKAAYHGHFMCVAIELFSKDKTSLVAQSVKKPPAMQESWVQSPGQEDPLEKGMATQSSILAWRIPWTMETGTVQSIVSQRAGHD